MEKNQGQGITFWCPRALLAWIDAQREGRETRSATIKRILHGAWDYSQTFKRVSAGEYLPPVPQGVSVVRIEGDAADLNRKRLEDRE